MSKKLDYQGAAQFLAELGIPISPFTLRTWVSKNRIAHIKLGDKHGRGMVFFDPDDLLAWVEAHRVMPAEMKAQ